MATALLVLDMLTGFTTGKLANPVAGQITGPIAAPARAARDRDDWLVVYGNDAHRPGGFELVVFREHAMAVIAGAAVVAELAPSRGIWLFPSATTPPSPRPALTPPAGAPHRPARSGRAAHPLLLLAHQLRRLHRGLRDDRRL
jgi:nicotinamidase-related amidase